MLTTPIEKYYYFDKNDKKCKMFESYAGIFDINQNRFYSKELCHSYCGGTIDDINIIEEIWIMPLKSEFDLKIPKNGNLNTKRYYCYHHHKICLAFQYGGINGNGNNFLTKEECSKICHD